MKLTKVLTIIGLLLFTISTAEARSFYSPPGHKTEDYQRKQARERSEYNNYRAREMLYNDLQYREMESRYKYNDTKRKLEIEKMRKGK
jgi:hypothetical protein